MLVKEIKKEMKSFVFGATVPNQTSAAVAVYVEVSSSVLT
jgi:hypothetical protein